MKKCMFLFFFFVFLGGYNYSQMLPIISDNIRVLVDTSAVRKGLDKMKKSSPLIYEKKIANLSQKDIDSMHILNYMYIYADTITREIKIKVDRSAFLIFFPSKKEFYIWLPSEVYLAPIDYAEKNAFLALLLSRIRNNYDSAFCISFFPQDKDRYYILGFKDKEKEDYIYMDAYYRTLYPSLSYMLSYYFGSPSNYVEIYKNRLRYKQHSRNFKDLLR